MANSSLATYTKLTANNSGKRTQKISKITPHYMAAYWTGSGCADYFYNCGVNGSRQCSSNYCIGVNGDIAVSVNEDCRAWTTSSDWNDQRAVTIECGNNTDSSLPDACYNALVKLCADICKRNGITPHYDGTINGSITMHRQFAATACPGDWLAKKIVYGQFEEDIKAAMGTAKTEKVTVPKKKNAVYRTYRKETGEHFYTSDVKEAQKVVDNGRVYEGVAWTMPTSGSPVYRLFNAKSSMHMLTTSDTERANLKKAGWIDEGQVMLAGKSGTPIFRLYNKNNGDHLFTASTTERDNLKKAGWSYECIAFYGA